MERSTPTPTHPPTQTHTQDQEKIAIAEPLTEEEAAEKEALSTDGFVDWNRRDFAAFRRACERHGRKKIDAIAKEIEVGWFRRSCGP